MKFSRKLTLFSLAFLPFALWAGEQPVSTKVSVEWQSPEDYTDVRPANESRKRFMDNTFHQFEQHFVKLAERLPENATWKITVTDVDLAGQVWPASFVGLGQGGQDVRLIKDIDIPRMSFSYELASEGELLQKGEVELKDMGFLQRSIRGASSTALRYEKRMLDEWFADEFGQYIATAKN
ncbi:DUF3016 domain-containing protein [Alteromonas flava]|uniref:DUF3016 domain-containing protein n=1 Tax=Alteromonas flava TaxID=2048003 RepID=UPI000C290E2A|nr:DUF3016 domain-containing protein [Alteromonas flava]